MIIHAPAFSPLSRYMLRDQDEVDYFTRCGGAPEARMIEWARGLVSHDMTFLDVGAHVGSWAQDLAQHCKHVYAFEPQRAVYQRLVDGCLFAHVHRNLEPIPIALGRREATAVMSHVSVDGGGSTLRHRAELGRVLKEETVHVRSLDELAKAHSFMLQDRIGLIKLDVEGHEGAVLEGAKETIGQHRPVILAEAWLHDWYRSERDLLATQIRDLGYRVTEVPGWPEMLWGTPL